MKLTLNDTAILKTLYWVRYEGIPIVDYDGNQINLSPKFGFLPEYMLNALIRPWPNLDRTVKFSLDRLQEFKLLEVENGESRHDPFLNLLVLPYFLRRPDGRLVRIERFCETSDNGIMVYVGTIDEMRVFQRAGESKQSWMKRLNDDHLDPELYCCLSPSVRNQLKNQRERPYDSQLQKHDASPRFRFGIFHTEKMTVYHLSGPAIAMVEELPTERLLNWDAHSRTLYYQGRKLLQLQRSAPRIEGVLQWMEENEFNECAVNFADQPDSRTVVQQAVKDINGKLPSDSPIRFGITGAGKCVRWIAHSAS